MPACHARQLLAAGTAIVLAASWCAAARAQTYGTQALLDQNTARPDGQGNFNIAWTVPPAFSGNTIAFVNYGASDQEYWVADTGAHSFTKLLDTSTRAPGGDGNFSNFVPPNNNLGGLRPLIQGSKLYFWAEDKNGSNGYGLYWISISGGAVHRVATYRTAKPEGGALDFINSFAASGTRVLFGTSSGVYVGTSTAAPLVVVADGNTQILINGGPNIYSCYNPAAIDGVNVAVSATNCFDPSSGPNVLFVGPYTNFASQNKLPVVNSNQTLPGDTNGSPHLDIVGDSVFLSGNTLYFGAVDTSSSQSGGFYGQYYAAFGANGVPATPSGSPIYRIFDNTTSGLTGSFGHFGSASFDQGTLAFAASNTATGTEGLYTATGLVPVLLSTDLQRGFAVPLGISSGRIAFGGAGFFDPQLDLVSASACGVAPVSTAKISRGPITVTTTAGEYQQTVTVKNANSTTVAGPIDLELTYLTAGASLLNRSGVTQCTSPAGVPFITVSSGALGPYKSASVTLDVWSPGSATFTFKPLAVSGSGTP